MRCPRCNALAADSDPYCLWCDARLDHSRSVPTLPTRRPFRGGPPRAGGPGYDGVGAAAGMVGMFVGSMVAAGATTSDFKPLVCGASCVVFPLLFVWLLVRLFGRRR